VEVPLAVEFEIVDLLEIRVVELGEGFELDLEALEGLGIAQILGQGLQGLGRLPFEEVVDEVDLAHAARTQFLLDPVAVLDQTGKGLYTVHGSTVMRIRVNASPGLHETVHEHRFAGSPRFI
jgi:hypothetical protein